MKDLPETKARIFKIPATQITEKSFGQKLYANLVMLGAIIKITNIINEKSMEKAIIDSVPKKDKGINIRAFKEGLKLTASI